MSKKFIILTIDHRHKRSEHNSMS